MPISRRAWLAIGGMNQTSGPIWPIRDRMIAITSGPPAKPSFSAAGMPGMKIGMLPTSTPSAMPMNTGIRSTCCRRRSELPSTPAAERMFSGVPTMERISPNCNFSARLR